MVIHINFSRRVLGSNPMTTGVIMGSNPVVRTVCSELVGNDSPCNYMQPTEMKTAGGSRTRRVVPRGPDDCVYQKQGCSVPRKSVYRTQEKPLLEKFECTTIKPSGLSTHNSPYNQARA